MPKDPLSNFEFPAEMRDFAARSVEQARKAFDGFVTAAQQAVSTVEGQANIAQTGAKDVSQKAMTFAERNIETSFDFAQKLVRARDPQEMIQIQSEFIKAQMETLTDQARELSEAAGKAATEASQPKS
ncbi:MAG TPA: phasin [Xanthobacteraceae bacterium]|nr:phasin [Xanthobacteraceae bacterium]